MSSPPRVLGGMASVSSHRPRQAAPPDWRLHRSERRLVGVLSAIAQGKWSRSN